jgi:hypothetical protein
MDLTRRLALLLTVLGPRIDSDALFVPVTAITIAVEVLSSVTLTSSVSIILLT